MTSIDRDDPWGVYRPGIESYLTVCADYLARLERSVAGEIAPDRPYFHDKAQNLHDAVRLMVRRGQDIERWLRACDATVDHHDEDGRTVAGTCERPSGHTGPHDDNPPREPVEQLCQQARTLSDLTDLASHRLGTVAPGVDQQTAVGGSVSPEELDELREVASMLDQAGRQARQLTQRVLDVATPEEACVGDGAPPLHGVQRSARGAGVEL